MFQSDNNVRKFQCFICGLVQDTYEEFREHIVTDHEEGREYVLCPLEHCKAPARDLRTHFRNKHPQTALPTNCQLKSAVWYDVRQPNRRKKKIAFEEGFFLSKKNGDKNMHYRSSYERKIYQILESLGEVSGYLVEPVNITYFFRGRQRTYIPDLFVMYADGRKELWEIKPANQTGIAQNRSKWDAARHWCANRGVNFKVITEPEMDRLLHEARDRLRD